MTIDKLTIQATIPSGELDALVELYQDRHIRETGMPFSYFLRDPNSVIREMNRKQAVQSDTQ